ncbi:MAG: SUMF1/EgtB/PvdO family nonheme iron enzyme [Armatimonadetes bacterium]|nr:SUMF1/EgtB/PvdO family nonheme iron enzyme [Armatimonadota bacterium]
MKYGVCFVLVGFALLLAWSLRLTADPSYYLRKSTWHDTLQSSRDVLVKQEEDEAKREAALGKPRGLQLGDWYSIGPFTKSGKHVFAEVFPPETEIDLGKSYEDGRFNWVKRPEYKDGTVHNLPSGDHSATYLYRTITTGVPTTLTGYFGSDDGLTVWLNGKKLISNDVPRGPAPNQDTAKLELIPGENKLLLKITNITGGYGYYFSTNPGPGLRDAKVETRNGLWNLVQRDFLDPESQLQMKWEEEDRLWLEDWMPADLKVLAKRYAAATRFPALSEEAKRLSERVDEAAGLQALREAYHRSRKADVAIAWLRDFKDSSLRLAIKDLSAAYGAKYPKGKEYLDRLDSLLRVRDTALAKLDTAEALQHAAKTAEGLRSLQRDALLANPLLDFDRLLFVKRRDNQLGLPQNWQGNSSIARGGYDNEICISPIGRIGPISSLFHPEGGRFVGDLDLHFDGDRFLFSMPDEEMRWQVYELRSDGTGLRQVTLGDQPDVDNFDGCYLPSGKIIFCSTACMQGVPCVGGADHVALLYLLDTDGKTIRQLTFDQDHNWCPTVLNNGRVLYTRWEYSDTPHYFTRLLFSMNPDGTDQAEYYGSNSYWPNSTFYARPIPGNPSEVVAVISGHHGVPRMGELVLFDPEKGRREGDGVVQRIPGYGKRVEPVIADTLVDGSWPKFLHPYPLSDKYFLVSCKPNPSAPWGIYLADIFDNMLPLLEMEGYALFEPTPIRKRPTPPVIPDKVNPKRKDAVVYMANVYSGDGLKGVPRGTVKKLRVSSNHFAFPGMGGHINIGIDGPWDVKRILGTVPVYSDGSAKFRAPANTPLVLQPLDAEGKALQVMRSWMTAMPGENVSCMGCHESVSTTPPSKKTEAALKLPVDIKPWHGPARGFSFEREVQPVLNTYCVSCHNGQSQEGKTLPDLRSKKEVANYAGAFTPAYESLHRYVRRPGPESDYHLLTPLEFHADTSELVQMLQKGHHGVKLDSESWDRLITWIDLNVPCHGRWSEHRAVPAEGDARRCKLRSLYAGDEEDPEREPSDERRATSEESPLSSINAPIANRESKIKNPSGWPLDGAKARLLQASLGPTERGLDLGSGVNLDLVLIPAGEFVMGDLNGEPDELPLKAVHIEKPFWMAKFETTNEQFRLFDPRHDSGYISQTNKDQYERGYPANGAKQPVIRVSWQQATDFCRWLSKKTELKFALPSEAQWEYTCRAGTDTPLSYGDLNADFSPFANVADASLRAWARRDSPDWAPKDARFNDKAFIAANVGSYEPNAWGLYDMHGNVCEWTHTIYQPFPYRSDDGRENASPEGRKVVRGGSWFDRPQRCRSAFRLSYPSWQKVYNVGFRVVCEGEMKPVNVVRNP